MADRMTPASFEDVEKPGDIVLDIGLRVDEGLPYPRLGGQIDNHLRLLFREEPADGILIGDVHLQEFEILPRLDLPDPIDLQTDLVVVVEIVEAEDIFAPVQKFPTEMESDEAGRAGDEDLLGHWSIPSAG